MKNTTILEEVYFYLSDRNTEENDFILETEYTEQLTNEISKNTDIEEKNKIDLVKYEMTKMGYINGFRSCIQLLKELHSIDDSLKGILKFYEK